MLMRDIAHRDRYPAGTDEPGLVARARAGDRFAFELLYRRHENCVRSLLRRLCGTDGVEDLVQEVFLRAYRGLSRFEGRSSFFTWLYRLAFNVGASHRRSLERRRARSVSAGDLAALPDTRGWSCPERRAVARVELERAVAALPRLPRSQRRLLMLGAMSGRPHAEVARRLGTTSRALKGRLHRARRRLREVLLGDAPRYTRLKR